MSTRRGSPTQVAESVPFDNDSNGFTSDNVQDAIEEARSPSDSVTPPFIFSKSGGAGVGAYLKVGEVLSSKTGQIVKGTNTIIGIECSNSATVGASGATIKLQRRTGLTTFSDIAGATVTIPNGAFSATATLNVDIGPDWELACYNDGPENLTDVVVSVFIVPR